MARWNGTTTQRGYGYHHQELRRHLLAQFTLGQPCARCQAPIWDKAQIDLGHTPDRRSYTGLEHRSCNRADGARRKNRKRWRTINGQRTITTPPLTVSEQRTMQPSRDW